MNINETIIELAQQNAKNFRPLRREDVNPHIPYFNISTTSSCGSKKYEVATFNFEAHENAPRMVFWRDYLKTKILPNIDPSIDISGYYNIELHDSYTYLNNEKDYKGVFCFSKFKNDASPILIPDPYQIGDFGGMLSTIKDPYQWDNKKSKITFCGTTTGHRDPLLNERINMCLWAKDKRQWTDFYITKIAQMNPQDVLTNVPAFKSVYRDPISIDEQLNYKYHLMMDGNTCRFDVWYLATNNLVFKCKSKEMLWYYPMLQNETHFVDVTKETMQSRFNYFENNPAHAQCIMFNARNFVNNFFRPISHQLYTINLFESLANNK